MNINGMKLVTGEDIIADVALHQDGRFLVKNAVELTLAPARVAGGPPTMGFTPFPPYAAQKKDPIIAIEPLHVVYYYTPDEDIVKNYEDMFNSASTQTNQIITG
jgi:hypothetical protein